MASAAWKFMSLAASVADVGIGFFGHLYRQAPGPRIVARFNAPKTLRLDSRYPLNVHIHATDESCFHPDVVEGSRPACRLIIEDEKGHFIQSTTVLESIPAHHTIETDVSLVPGNFASSIAELPLGLTLTLKSHDGVTLSIAKINTDFSAFRPTVECEDMTKCNILSIGYPETGKSTFAMTVLSALLSYIVPMPGIGGSDTHVTRRVTRYALSDWILDFLMNIIDTCGIGDQNFTLELLDNLVKGNLPDGYDMHGVLAGKKIGKTPGVANMPAPTAVLFFIRAVSSQNSALMNRMQTYIERVTLLGHSPLVIVTFNTELDEKTAAESVHDISRHLKIPPTRIFPFDGYVKQPKTVPAVDQNVMKILEMAARTSDAYVKASARPRAREIQEAKEQLVREELAKKERIALENDKLAQDEEKLARENSEKKERLAAEKNREEALAHEKSARIERQLREEAQKIVHAELQRLESERAAREELERKERVLEMERKELETLLRAEAEWQEKRALEDLEAKKRAEKSAHEDAERVARITREDSEKKERIASEDEEGKAMRTKELAEMKQQIAREQAEQSKQWTWQAVNGTVCALVIAVATYLVSRPCTQEAPAEQLRRQQADQPASPPTSSGGGASPPPSAEETGECVSPPPASAATSDTRAVTPDAEDFINVEMSSKGSHISEADSTLELRSLSAPGSEQDDDDAHDADEVQDAEEQ